MIKNSTANRSNVSRKLIFLTTIFLLLFGVEAFGQSSTVDVAQANNGRTIPVIDFNIPSQNLGTALNIFAGQSNLQVSVPTAMTDGKVSKPVFGSFVPKEALKQLLSDTGLSYRFTAGDTVTLEKQAAADKELTPIQVQGQFESAESAHGPVDGYVAKRGTTGAKTDTPLIETPQSISVITRDRLENQNTSSISEALRYTPGVIGEVFGNDSRVDFLQYRGFDESGVGVFRDGLQVRSSGFAESQQDLYGAQRSEVLRGPASVLYGQSPLGGVVNIVTKRPTFEPFREIIFEAGNFDHYEGKFDVGGPIADSDKFFFRLTGLARESNTQLGFVEDDRIYIAPALTLRPNSNTSLTFLSHYQYDTTGSTNQFLPAEGTVLGNINGEIPVSRFIGDPDFDTFDRTAYSVGYEFEHKTDQTWTFRQNLRFNHVDVDYATASFGAGLAADQRTLDRFSFTSLAESDFFTVDNQVQAKFVTGPAEHTFLFGVDYQYFDFEQANGFDVITSIDIFNPDYSASIGRPPVTSDSNIIQHQVGLYVQEQLRLHDRWIFTLGGRQDFVSSEQTDLLGGTTTDQDDTSLSGRLGLVYLFDFGFAPYVNYARSFLPTVGANAVGEAFVPETGQQYEVGMKYQPPGSNSSVAVAFFDLTRQNVITTDPNDPNNEVQTGEVRSVGFEFEGIASFDFGLNLTAAYTYQDVEITESNSGDQGKTPTSVPESYASLWGDYTFQPNSPLKGLNVGMGMRYRGSTFGNVDNTLVVGSYGLLDGAVHYDWENYKFSLNLKNMLNHDYVGGCSSESACFLGSARTVTGSVKFRW